MRLEYASPASRSQFRIHWPVVGLLVFAVAIRLGWVLHLDSDEKVLSALPDQVGYLELGRNLLAGKGLNFVDPRLADTAHAFRMPGYPLLVAACQGNIKFIRIVQCLLDGSSILATYLLARRWLSTGAALFCAALVAVNPFLIYFCGLLLSETLFTSMLIWGMTCMVTMARGWILGAVLLALSVLVRPSGLALPIVLGSLSALVDPQIRRPYGWRFSPPVATLMLLFTAAVLFPWAWRNQRVLGQWVWTTTNSGFTLYDGFNPDATGASDQSFARGMPQLKSMGEVQRSQYLSDRAWEFVRQNPLHCLKLAVVKMARTLSPIPLSSEYGSDIRLVLAALLYVLPLDTLAIVGLWRSKVARPAQVFLLAPLLYFTIVHAASVGSLRYRIPADVPIAILAGLGLASTTSFARSPDAQEPADA